MQNPALDAKPLPRRVIQDFELGNIGDEGLSAASRNRVSARADAAGGVGRGECVGTLSGERSGRTSIDAILGYVTKGRIDTNFGGTRPGRSSFDTRPREAQTTDTDAIWRKVEVSVTRDPVR